MRSDVTWPIAKPLSWQLTRCALAIACEALAASIIVAIIKVRRAINMLSRSKGQGAPRIRHGLLDHGPIAKRNFTRGENGLRHAVA